MKLRLSLLITLLVIGLLATGTAWAQQRMIRYLVTGAFVEPGALLTPQQLAPLLERVITPSLDMLAKWDGDKKIMGGIPAGARAVAFVIEAASNDELAAQLQSLPFWGVIKWKVTPLESFSRRAAADRTMAERLKGMR